MTRTESDIEAVLVAQSAVIVDTDAVIARTKRGARARRYRRTATAVVASVVTVTVAIATPVVLAGRPDATGPGQAPSTNPSPTDIPACTAHALDLPAGIDAGPMASGVTDMDPTGRYAVGWYRPSHLSAAEGADVLVRWDNGVPHPLPVSGLDVYAAGVNSAGVVAGYVSRTHADQSAWVYADGKVTTLPLPAGYSSAAATAVNGRGEVLGTVYTDSGDHRPVVWSVDGSWAPRLLEPGGAGAFDIADDGTVVGVVPGPVQPYAWDPDGVGRVLPVPAGAQQAMPVAVRGEWAAGGAQERPGAEIALRWNLRTGEVSVVGGWESAFASAVNARGDVALASTSGTGGLPRLVRDGGVTELPRLPPRPGESVGPGEPQDAVVALSDDGTIAAGSQSTVVIDPSSNQGRVVGQRAVLWRC